MSKKNVKRFAAVTMAAVMTCGSAMAVFADSTVTGQGTYEGKDGEKPTISITLPTATELANVYNYHADPNNLISSSADQKGSLGSSATVEAGHKGILFETDTAGTYGATSKKFEVTSENLQDVDITVDVKIKTAGDSSIEYADTNTFETTDTAKKLYLAIVNGESGDAAKSAALTASGVKLTQTAAGAADNYELTYNSSDSKYVYTKKTSPDPSKWNKVGFAMTGAINTNAEWGEGVKFPELEVTWSFAEHTDSYVSGTTVSTSSKALTLSMPDGVTVSKMELTLNGGNPITLSRGNQYTISGTTLTFGSYASSWVGGIITITYSDNHSDAITCQ